MFMERDYKIIETKMKYEVTVKEIIYGFVTVEAASFEEAEQKTHEAYHGGMIEMGGDIDFEVKDLLNLDTKEHKVIDN